MARPEPFHVPPNTSVTATGITVTGSAIADILALFQRPLWQSDGACKEHPEVNFYPERGESVEPARAVCAGCLVRDECAAFALDMGDQFGIWGGLSNRERNRIRRAKPKAPELPSHGTPGRYRKGCRCDPCRHAQQKAKAKVPQAGRLSLNGSVAR